MSRIARRFAPLCLSLLFYAAAAAGDNPAKPASYLFLWAGDAAKQHSDFLAVVDADPSSKRYGQVIATVPVGQSGTEAHHTEADLHSSGILLANGFDAGRTFIFDLRQPAEPRLLGSFDDLGGFAHPHSFLRLANGNVLATFQYRAGAHDRPGGLVELDPQGRMVRASGPADNPVDANFRPYSPAVLPALDRVITTTTDMHGAYKSRSVQVWRFSDLALLHTIPLPDPPAGYGAEWPAEPRILSDDIVLVNTFTCGLFRVTGVEGKAPAARFLHQFEGKDCGVPLLIGRYWVQTLESAGALVSLDLKDPERPREVSRLNFAQGENPHWIAYDRLGCRIVVTGAGELRHRVLMVRFDEKTGKLAWDESFREPGSQRLGISFDRTDWPHGEAGPAVPHGSVFSLQ